MGIMKGNGLPDIETVDEVLAAVKVRIGSI
jgi:hypothetical protein